MTELTIRLSEFDSALLGDLVKNTGKSKTALVTDGLRFLHGSMRDNSPVTRFPMKEFDELLKQLEEGEKDGIVYHHPGLLTGDYDGMENEEDVWALLEGSKKPQKA